MEQKPKTMLSFLPAFVKLASQLKRHLSSSRQSKPLLQNNQNFPFFLRNICSIQEYFFYNSYSLISIYVWSQVKVK